ncbi:hypothetical protein FHY12_002581 [Xanthomonas arboricola]|nr:hypothetical protein [Xanthomonas euroxanthea]
MPRRARVRSYGFRAFCRAIHNYRSRTGLAVRGRESRAPDDVLAARRRSAPGREGLTGNAMSRPGALLRVSGSLARAAQLPNCTGLAVRGRESCTPDDALAARRRSAPGREGLTGNATSRPGALLRVSGSLAGAAQLPNCAGLAVRGRESCAPDDALAARRRSAPGREGLTGNAMSRPGALLRVMALMRYTQPRLRNHASGTTMLSTITPSAQ